MLTNHSRHIENTRKEESFISRTIENAMLLSNTSLLDAEATAQHLPRTLRIPKITLSNGADLFALGSISETLE